MNFYIDEQTLSDIEIFSKGNRKSIFDIYNKAITTGGSDRLYRYFRNPTADAGFLNQKKQEIHFVKNFNVAFNISKRQLDAIEYYLKIKRNPLKANVIDAYKDKVVNWLKPDGEYYIIEQGIFQLIQLFSGLNNYISELKCQNFPKSFNNCIENVNNLTGDKTIRKYINHPPHNFKSFEINKLDYFFRVRKKTELREILNFVYELDVLQTLSSLLENNYCQPEFVTTTEPLFDVVDFYHPFLDKPQYNSFKFSSNSSICFLTGPNMAGKSTFLKSVGLLVYLAHLGFPVPARKMLLSVRQGLFTTINLSDNLSLGFSHFYSEVKRVKQMTEKLYVYKNLVVIFDELFRGTNVKDAYEATLLITRLLAKITTCQFFISSHILEVAENLHRSEHIMYRCFTSVLENDTPHYDYKLKEGVSIERTGLQIIRNEKIKELLESVISRNKSN